MSEVLRFTGNELLKKIPDQRESSMLERIIFEELGSGALSYLDFTLTNSELAAVDREFQLETVSHTD
jgi:hypothetical protein